MSFGIETQNSVKTKPELFLIRFVKSLLWLTRSFFIKKKYCQLAISWAQYRVRIREVVKNISILFFYPLNGLKYQKCNEIWWDIPIFSLLFPYYLGVCQNYGKSFFLDAFPFALCWHLHDSHYCWRQLITGYWVQLRNIACMNCRFTTVPAYLMMSPTKSSPTSHLSFFLVLKGRDSPVVSDEFRIAQMFDSGHVINIFLGWNVQVQS